MRKFTMFILVVISSMLLFTALGCNDTDNGNTNVDDDGGTDEDTSGNTDSESDTNIIDYEEYTGITDVIAATTPFPASDNQKWLWVPVEGTYCMNGSQAGVSIRRNADSQNLIIHFELGGACFNGNTCDTSLTVTKITEETRLPIWGMNGIFNVGEEENPYKELNPFKDYSMVYIPYCTGDVHTGSSPNTKVPGYDPLAQFVGADNYRIFLGHILATFPKVDKLVLSGFSGGALGAAYHAQRTARSFGDNAGQMYVMADSAVAMRPDYLPICHQQKVYQLWHMEKYFPKGCPDCDPMEEGGALHRMYENFAEEFPNVPYGLISSHEDIIMRTFYGWSNNNCDPGADIIYAGERYKDSIFDMREYFKEIGWGGTYFYLGNKHGMLNFNAMYVFGEEDTKLLDWLNDFLEGKTSHVDVPLDPEDLELDSK